MRSYPAFLLYGAFALISLPAIAQSNSATPDPVQSGAREPEMKYESAFERYVPYREQPLATWRDVNDEVGRVGGHVGMFGGAGHGGTKPGPAEPPAGASASASKEAPGQAPARGAPAAPQSQHKGH